MQLPKDVRLNVRSALNRKKKSIVDGAAKNHCPGKASSATGSC
jgi:hypothetical protein